MSDKDYQSECPHKNTCLYKCKYYTDCIMKHYMNIKRENEELKNKNTKLKKQINDLEFKYEILGKQYKKILQLAKQNADSFEYCMRDTEQLYEKAITKLKENGLYDAKDFESEE